MDLDGDGIKDIISGNYVTDNDKGIGSVHILKGLGEGQYAAATEVLNLKGKPVIAAKTGDDETYDSGQICIHPFAVDWEGDGDLDFVIGNFIGSFTLVLNEKKKDAKENAFQAQGTLIKIDGSDQVLAAAGQFHSAPFVIDWDGDGDLDLLAATVESPLSLAENIGTREQPRFKGFRQLIHMGDKPKAGPAGSFRSWIADVNGDGKFDVLAGDSFTEEKPKKGLSNEKFEEKRAEWQAKMDKAEESFIKLQEEFQPLIEKMLDEGKDPGDDEELMARYEKVSEPMQELYKAREEFLESTMTGRVWLYLAK